MAKNLSIKDLENLVFTNKIIQSKLPKYKFLFDSYFMSLINPSFKNLGIRSLIEFSNLVTPADVKIISDELGFEVDVSTVYNSKVNYLEGDINSIELMLDIDQVYSDMTIYRNKNKVKVLQWR